MILNLTLPRCRRLPNIRYTYSESFRSKDSFRLLCQIYCGRYSNVLPYFEVFSPFGFWHLFSKTHCMFCPDTQLSESCVHDFVKDLLRGSLLRNFLLFALNCLCNCLVNRAFRFLFCSSRNCNFNDIWQSQVLSNIGRVQCAFQ